MTNRDFEDSVTRLEPLWRKQYDDGVKRHLDTVESTQNEVFMRWVEKQPDAPYIIHKGRTLSYKESNNAACRLADSLLKMGCRKGEPLVLALPNIPAMIIGFLACYKTGMIAVGLNPRSSLREMAHNLGNNRAETIIISAQHMDKALQLLEQGTSLHRVIVVGEHSDRWKTENVFDFDCLLTEGEAKEPATTVQPEDYQILCYTGGTTGPGKGCCHRNKTLVRHALTYQNWFAPLLGNTKPKIVMCLPLSHSYGMHFSTNWCMSAGGSVILLEQTSSDAILEAINTYEPNVWPAVPALIRSLVQHPQVKESKINSLALIICGGAPIGLETLVDLQTLTKAKILHGFGMSESLCTVSFNPLIKGGKLPSVGIPLSDVDVLIVDLETGQKVLDFGERGEVIYRGLQVISDYWRMPEETASSFHEGWMYSGDIGYMDEDGFLYIVDRKKDMVITGGFNVYPREIDDLLTQHPKIVEACTIGVSDPRLGETLKSFVVLSSKEVMTEQDVIDYCKECMTAYKAPRYVEFIEEIPKTSVNKYDKKALKNRESEQ